MRDVATAVLVICNRSRSADLPPMLRLSPAAKYSSLLTGHYSKSPTTMSPVAVLGSVCKPQARDDRSERCGPVLCRHDGSTHGSRLCAFRDRASHCTQRKWSWGWPSFFALDGQALFASALG